MSRTTTIINLFAGPGAGKSTLAAEIFHKLKTYGRSVELVREYVKDWAWEGRKIKPFDQFYITAQQFKRESVLYGKVDYIITDSPVVLGSFYEEYYQNSEILWPSIERLMKDLDSQKITRHCNFFISRNKKYVHSGRFETEDQARAIDTELSIWLKKKGIPFEYVGMNDEEKADWIIGEAGIYEKIKEERNAAYCSNK